MDDDVLKFVKEASENDLGLLLEAIDLERMAGRKWPLDDPRREMGERFQVDTWHNYRLSHWIEQITQELTIFRAHKGLFQQFVEENFTLDPTCILLAKQVKWEWRHWKRTITMCSGIREQHVLEFMKRLDPKNTEGEFYGLKLIDSGLSLCNSLTKPIDCS